MKKIIKITKLDTGWLVKYEYYYTTREMAFIEHDKLISYIKEATKN